MKWPFWSAALIGVVAATVVVVMPSAVLASPSANSLRTPPGGQSVSIHRTTLGGVKLTLRLKVGCVDWLAATGKHVSLLVVRTPGTPTGALVLREYEPLSGAVVAYTSTTVTSVEWRSPTGRVVDRMRPWHGWVVELGPVVHRPRIPQPLPAENVGTLVALGHGGRVLESLAVSTANAVLLPPQGSGCLSTSRNTASWPFVAPATAQHRGPG